MNQDILSVSEFTHRIKRLLEGGFRSVRLKGEVSNLKMHSPSGHIYFTLKDESASIAAVVWRSRVAQLKFVPEDGMNVIVSGRLVVYDARGVYQIEVYSVEPAGLGELQVAFEKLKQRLSGEGLFDPSHKIPIPRFPERVGIVTSSSGAAIQDLLSVLKRRDPGIGIVLRPAAVQGPGAARDIARAIDEMNEYGAVDVVIVSRGGGSLEDLWAFNEEVVARAIYRSELPVISAVGHEIDFTIADFVADLRAPTPSAAAEIAVQDRAAVLDIIRHKWYTIENSVVSQLDRQQKQVQHLLHSHALNRPIDTLHQMGQRIDDIERSIRVSITHRLAMQKAATSSLEHRIQALNPMLVLRRGYAMVSQGARLISSARNLRHPANVEIRFHDGVVPATIMDKA